MRIKGREWNRMRSRKAEGKEKEEQREDEMRSIVATDQLADYSFRAATRNARVHMTSWLLAEDCRPRGKM